MTNLAALGKELFEVNLELKAVEERKTRVREKLLQLLDLEAEENLYKLPLQSIAVPKNFWKEAEIDRETFLETRFPGYDVIASSENDDGQVFILRRNPRYYTTTKIVNVGEDRDYSITKQITNGTPKIDWDTLKRERPDIFERLAVPDVRYKVNDEEFEKLQTEWPEFLTFIRRHTMLDEPGVKIVPKWVKKNDE
jgi:hypothetical protein